MEAGKTMSYHGRLLHRDLPAGTFSTKDALDDGNAYDSATRATVARALGRPVTSRVGGGPFASARPFDIGPRTCGIGQRSHSRQRDLVRDWHYISNRLNNGSDVCRGAVSCQFARILPRISDDWSPAMRRWR